MVNSWIPIRARLVSYGSVRLRVSAEERERLRRVVIVVVRRRGLLIVVIVIM